MISATLDPICTKPAEAGRPTYCNSMLAPLLEDDPKNCGACGASCGGGHCCAGRCNDSRCCTEAPGIQRVLRAVCVEKDTPTIWLDTAELSR